MSDNDTTHTHPAANVSWFDSLSSFAHILRCVLVSLCCVQSTNLYLIQMDIDTQSGRLVGTLKTDSSNPTNVNILVNMIKETLAPLC
jgi:hypothetical protein